MKKIAWIMIGLVASACVANVASGCGSDNSVNIGDTDGGGDGLSE
jgi:hypothetical protein